MKTERLSASFAVLLLFRSVSLAADPPPDDLDASVSAMAQIGVCYSASFSPDGTRIAFVSDLGGIPQVWTVADRGRLARAGDRPRRPGRLGLPGRRTAIDWPSPSPPAAG